jgi:hypothetical protein
MPEVYACRQCGLTFEVGWYHYHDFSSGYAAETLLVCRECGTAHAVEHAVTPRQDPDLGGELPADQGPIWRPDRILRQPGPIRVPTDTDAPLFLPAYADWLPCGDAPTIRPDRVLQPFIGMEGIADGLALGVVRCGHCGVLGSLLDRWPDEGAPCPGCGAPIRDVVDSWRTW